MLLHTSENHEDREPLNKALENMKELAEFLDQGVAHNRKASIIESLDGYDV